MRLISPATVTLELTVEECQVLIAISRNISGKNDGPRAVTDRLLRLFSGISDDYGYGNVEVQGGITLSRLSPKKEEGQ